MSSSAEDDISLSEDSSLSEGSSAGTDDAADVVLAIATTSELVPVD